MMLLGHSSPQEAHARRMSTTLQELTSPHRIVLRVVVAVSGDSMAAGPFRLKAQLGLISYTLIVTLPSVVGLSIQKSPSTLKSG
jgi:hypothetical protein